MPEARKPRPRREWIMVVLQPLASRCVAWAARRRIDPRTVVAAHALLGLAAAGLLARHASAALVAAAVLLQLKTLLDNVDGGLARVTGRVTEAGRYLDTSADLIVNIALFAALTRHGPTVPAWLALVVLTLMLSLDFNLEGRYRELRDEPGGAATPLPPGAPGWILRLLEGLYRVVFEPQDRWLRRLDRTLFERVSGRREADAPADLRRTWNDLFSTASIVNLGLSSQLALLGLSCLLGRPYLYVVAVYLQLVYVLAIQAVRVARLRRAVRHGRGSTA
jgi:hypothetical protein